MADSHYPPREAFGFFTPDTERLLELKQKLRDMSMQTDPLSTLEKIAIGAEINALVEKRGKRVDDLLLLARGSWPHGVDVEAQEKAIREQERRSKQSELFTSGLEYWIARSELAGKHTPVANPKYFKLDLPDRPGQVESREAPGP